MGGGEGYMSGEWEERRTGNQDRNVKNKLIERKEGRMEGRREGRKEERKEG